MTAARWSDAADLDDLLAAARVAPLVVPFVVSVWVMLYDLIQLAHLPAGQRFGSPGAMIATVVVGAVVSFVSWPAWFLGAAIGYAMTFCLGLPAVLLWRRVRGRIGVIDTVSLGALLGVSPIFVVYWRHLTLRVLTEPYFWLFASCGAATAGVFWYVGLRDPTAA